MFIARQPIYDKNLNVFAYELLYRDDEHENAYESDDPDLATISVLIETFVSIGIDSLTNKKLGFINFTENLLLSGAIKMLPKQYLGIELLETIRPTEYVLDVCRELKALGYTIVLDDYVYSEATKVFTQYADIVKIDFLQSTDAQIRGIVNEFKGSGIKFIAEKIETHEDFEKAKACGYDCFQGYYFERPSLLQSKDLLPLQINALKVFEMLQDENCDVYAIAAVVSSDPGMAYKLFRLANSVMYGGRNRIKNIQTAMMRIGLKDLQIWILYIMLYGENKNRPDELIRQSMLRAWAAQEICKAKNLSEDVSSFSLIGLFSLLDAIMDATFETILSRINISEEVTAALLNPGNDVYGAAIKLIRAYDEGNWEEAQSAGSRIDLSLEEYQKIYLKAIEWCDGRYSNLLFGK